MRKQDGFSLIELMVVVAIIGVLAAIAIPQLDGFRQKARASEARTSLGSIYTSQKAFFYEGSTYSEDIESVGVRIEGANRSYNVGFGAVPTGGTLTACPATASPGTPCHYFAANGGATAAAPHASCDATGTTFEAGAFGDVSTLSDQYDGFSINQSKTLTVEPTARQCS